MFYNKTYQNKDIVIVPKSKNNLKTFNQVDVKPNNNNKTYENIRNIVQNDDGSSTQQGYTSKPVDIKSIPKNDGSACTALAQSSTHNNIKNNFKNIF
jgi:hypothetical protein